MQLDNFYSENHGFIQFSREQASSFAKSMAGDFNPIHNPDSKRFCVPGDLLFSCSLAKHGLNEQMLFRFSGMVGSETALDFRPTDNPTVNINNEEGKQFLSIERGGNKTHDASLINTLTRQYVAYSGLTFPHLLVPLMAEQNVMINPHRPLVIYESMQINLKTLEINTISLEPSNNSLAVNGKRGEATLEFRFVSDGETIGTGSKTMLLSGLRPFEQDTVNDLVENYQANKTAHSNV